MSETAPKFGTVAFIGRPTAGKSTLMNRVLGEKVSIVSDKPQTTRNRIIGILNDPRGQAVFVDTPGIHKPLHKMNVRMMDHVVTSLGDADVAAVLVDASESFGHGEEFVLKMVQNARREGVTFVCILNKIDLVKKAKLLPILQRYADTKLFDELIPISASTGDGTDLLLNVVFAHLPEGAPRYAADIYTTQPERFLAAEIVREKLLHHMPQELPYSTAVSVDKWEDDTGTGMTKIFATIFVERDTQKKIVVGKGGDMIKKIGTEARLDLEQILASRVYLDLHVSVHESWREDERFLGELDWSVSRE